MLRTASLRLVGCMGVQSGRGRDALMSDGCARRVGTWALAGRGARRLWVVQGGWAHAPGPIGWLWTRRGQGWDRSSVFWDVGIAMTMASFWSVLSSVRLLGTPDVWGTAAWQISKQVQIGAPIRHCGMPPKRVIPPNLAPPCLSLLPSKAPARRVQDRRSRRSLKATRQRSGLDGNLARPCSIDRLP